MNDERSYLENHARRLYTDQKKIFELIAPRPSETGLESVVRRLFGDRPIRGKNGRFNNQDFIFFGSTNSLISFLPVSWYDEFQLADKPWRGCENWWAGLPLIVLLDLRANDEGNGAQVRIHAEVGPIADHNIRKNVIDVIETAAVAAGLGRIRFQGNASDKGRLYSRFFRQNSVALEDVRKPEAVERKVLELVAAFEPEIIFVADIIPQLLHANDKL